MTTAAIPIHPRHREVAAIRDAERLRARDASDNTVETEASELPAKDSCTISETLVRLALSKYRLGQTVDGEPFAVQKDGPNIARMFRGRDSLRAQLAREYRRQEGRTPTQSALADALVVLEGEASDCDHESVWLRIARDGDDVIVDLGDVAGRAVRINGDGWDVIDRSPVLFRRSALTAPLPMPERGGSLADLRTLMNVTDRGWCMTLGAMVASLLYEIPHPIVMTNGQQGSGKTSLARLMVAMTDPSPAPLRAEPRDPEGWAVCAAGSHVIAMDNLSSISAWLSDALCKSVTGDGLIRRRLYADSDLTVISFRRCIIVTTIDAGVLRGDLADRLVMVDLDRIRPDHRRTDAELAQTFAAAHPLLLGAFYGVVAAVLRVLPSVHLREMPRMADFARVLAALDVACPQLTAGDALDTYLGQGPRLAQEVLEGDHIAERLIELLTSTGPYTGTSGELLHVLRPEGDTVPKGWPTSAKGLSSRLKRLAPALREVGIIVDLPSPETRSATRRVLTITKVAT